MEDNARTIPKVMVTWAHRDASWSESQVERRAQQVHDLVQLLRAHGIDADADLFHQGVDWTRWGPRAVSDADFVIALVSSAWRDAWEGRGDPTRGAGAAGEADTLRSMYARNRMSLEGRLRLIILPGSSPDEIPDGLHGVERFDLRATWDSEPAGSLVGLLRDLTGQPEYVLNDLGPLPALPPATRPPTASGPSNPTHGPLVYSAIDELPPIPWRAQDRGAIASTRATAVTYVAPIPATSYSTRQMLAMSPRVEAAFRAVVPESATIAVDVSRTDDVLEVAIQDEPHVTPTHRASLLSGLRVHRSGVIAVSHALPRDSLSSFLDEGCLRDGIAASLRLAGEVEPAVAPSVVLAAEIHPLTLVTLQSMETFESTNSRTLDLSFSGELRLEPDEAVDSRVLSTHAGEAAATIAALLIHKARHR